MLRNKSKSEIQNQNSVVAREQGDPTFFASPGMTQPSLTGHTACLRVVQSASVFKKRSDRCRLELLTAAQELQLNEKLRFKEISAGLPDQGSRSS